MNGSKTFETVLFDYFERQLKDQPVFAVIAGGLPEAEGKLGELSPDFHLRRERERRRTLHALEKISPRDLDNEQHLDRLALRNLIACECEDFARDRSGLEPNAPEHLFSILLKELQRGEDSPGRAARNLRSLLRQAPRFLDEALRCLKNPDPVWTTIMEEAIAGEPSLLTSTQKLLESQSPSAADARLLSNTTRSLQRYRDKVRSLKPAKPGSFSLGATALQRRIRDDLGLDYSLSEVEQLALSEINRISGLIKAVEAKRGGTRAQRRIVDEQENWRPTRPLLEIYEETTQRVANCFKAAKALSFPGDDELRIRPVPEFLRAVIATAAYDAPGAFVTGEPGIFWVNDPSLTRSSEAEKLAEVRQHFGISLTCAHEAYPGHHLQFLRANRHPRKWRRLFAHAVFYEGWTLWCEQMMVDLRIDRAPWLEQRQLHDALWRCHRILLDLRLHTGVYTHEQGVRHLQRELGFTRNRAVAEINWYTTKPGVPMSYWLGRLENERLHRRLVKGRGWSLRKFNDWLLSFGTLPQSWIEKYGLD
jgi:uncharacterized protein (DUF885 family)